MAHSSVVLDKRFPKKDNTLPVKIRITHKGEFYIGTNIDIFATQWTEIADSSSLKAKTGTVMNHPLANRLNNIIASKKLAIDKKLLDLSESGQLLKMDNASLKTFYSPGKLNRWRIFSKSITRYFVRVKPNTVHWIS